MGVLVYKIKRQLEFPNKTTHFHKSRLVKHPFSLLAYFVLNLEGKHTQHNFWSIISNLKQMIKPSELHLLIAKGNSKSSCFRWKNKPGR